MCNSTKNYDFPKLTIVNVEYVFKLSGHPFIYVRFTNMCISINMVANMTVIL